MIDFHFQFVFFFLIIWNLKNWLIHDGLLWYKLICISWCLVSLFELDFLGYSSGGTFNDWGFIIHCELLIIAISKV